MTKAEINELRKKFHLLQTGGTITDPVLYGDAPPIKIVIDGDEWSSYVNPSARKAQLYDEGHGYKSLVDSLENRNKTLPNRYGTYPSLAKHFDKDHGRHDSNSIYDYLTSVGFESVSDGSGLFSYTPEDMDYTWDWTYIVMSKNNKWAIVDEEEDEDKAVIAHGDGVKTLTKYLEKNFPNFEDMVSSTKI